MLGENQRILAVGDYHNLPEQCWARIPVLARRESVTAVVSLGDIDGREDVRNLQYVAQELARMGIPLYQVRGNHCQWWLDAFRERQTVGELGNGADPLDQETASHIGALPLEQRLNHTIARHTFPVGPVVSGPHAPHDLWDAQLRYPDLWRYSFNAHHEGDRLPSQRPKGSKNWFEEFNPRTVVANLEWMIAQDALLLLIGHEHQAKVRYFGSDGIEGGEVLPRGSEVKVDNPSIVQVPAFHRGRYVVVDTSPKGYNVRFLMDTKVYEATQPSMLH